MSGKDLGCENSKTKSQSSFKLAHLRQKEHQIWETSIPNQL